LDKRHRRVLGDALRGTKRFGRGKEFIGVV
jgi:hypothetical protein